MHPIYFNIGLETPLMIMPDTQAHLNGHTIITRTYHIYKQTKDIADLTPASVHNLGLNKNTEPGYMGYITFDVPGRAFTYTADGKTDLSSDEVMEVIEHINAFRDNPGLWPK